MKTILHILSFVFAIILFGGVIAYYLGYLDNFIVIIIGGGGLTLVQYIQRIIARSGR